MLQWHPTLIVQTVRGRIHSFNAHNLAQEFSCLSTVLFPKFLQIINGNVIIPCTTFFHSSFYSYESVSMPYSPQLTHTSQTFLSHPNPKVFTALIIQCSVSARAWHCHSHMRPDRDHQNDDEAKIVCDIPQLGTKTYDPRTRKLFTTKISEPNVLTIQSVAGKIDSTEEKRCDYRNKRIVPTRSIPLRHRHRQTPKP